MTDGLRANQNGLQLENEIQAIFDKDNISIFTHKEWEAGHRPAPALIKNYPYTGIYGSRCRAEFVFVQDTELIRIECRYQRVAASVDEKFPYLLETCLFAPDHPKQTILILEGEGYREGVKQWIVSKTKTYQGDRRFNLFSKEDLRQWLFGWKQHISYTQA